MTIVETLQASLGAERVLTDDATLDARRHDYWVLSQLDDIQGRAAPQPACVVRPSSVADVVSVVNACRDGRVPLIPYGLGSGVCGAVLATPHSVVLDMSAMRRIREVDAKNLLATFDAGVRGSDAEAAVAKEGLTIGHFPQSIDVSSVGGWLATRAAGQFSTGYGNIEDIVLALEAVLPNGEVLETRRTPRASSGPDLCQLLLGSEGTLGVITGVTLSLRRSPEKRAASAFHLESMAAGFELQREIVQRGWAPVVVRQYDSTEAQRMFSAYARQGSVLLLLAHEGPAPRVDAETTAIAGIARGLGAESASPEAVGHWLAERNKVPTFKSFLESGIILDTIEVAATWDRIEEIYRRSVEALRQIPGMLAASAHSSHVYRSGLNLYFTFVAQPPQSEGMRATYLEAWNAVMRVTVESGGGIAHHHGIGRVRRDWLESEIGATGVGALRALKHALDPVGFMNPGALLPGTDNMKKERGKE